MIGVDVILNNIYVLGIAVLIGFIAFKSGYVPETVRTGLSTIIVRVTLPILVVTTLTKLELDRERLINCLTVIAAAFVTIGMMYILGAAMSRLFRMKGERAVLHSCMTCFGNIVFVAYPLIGAVYGDEGLLYAALFAFANDCYLWTMGVYKLSTVNSKGVKFTQNLKKLLNPGTVAVVIAFIMMGFKLRFGGVIKTSLEGIAGITSFLSMLFLGGTLAGVDFRQIYKRVSLYALTLVKMLIFPAALVFLFRLTGIDRTVAGVVVMQCAMPASTVLAILAEEYKCDVLYAAEGSFITTVLCIGTIPLVYRLISTFLA